jgi:hypothetical protein
MATAKEALLSAGRIKEIGRGRISNDNHAWLKQQYDNGVRFTDWPKGEVISSTGPDEKPVIRVKRDPKLSTEKVVREYTILYDRDAYVAVSTDGKEYGMAEVCNNCRVSLVQNVCENPVILGDVKVSIRARK